MTPRMICPHCHGPIDPQTLEPAASADWLYRICPECDEPIVLAPAAGPDAPAPTPSPTGARGKNAP